MANENMATENMVTENIAFDIDYPMEMVWDRISCPENFSWRSDLKAIRIMDNTTFEEVSRRGTVTSFKILDLVEFDRIVFELENRYVRGSITCMLSGKENSTNLNFEIAILPKKTAFSYLIGSNIRKKYVIFLRDLKRDLDRSKTM